METTNKFVNGKSFKLNGTLLELNGTLLNSLKSCVTLEHFKKKPSFIHNRPPVVYDTALMIPKWETKLRRKKHTVIFLKV